MPERTFALSRLGQLTRVVVAVSAGALALALAYFLFVDVQAQLRRVEIMEKSHRLYESDGADRFDADPTMVAFANDPVFSTPEWSRVLEENRKMMGGQDGLDAAAHGIWWPGLKERAKAALPAVLDRSEVVTATGTALGVCIDSSLTVDQRIAKWTEKFGHAGQPQLDDNPYWQAKVAAMPAIIRAGTPYFCGAGEADASPPANEKS